MKSALILMLSAMLSMFAVCGEAIENSRDSGNGDEQKMISITVTVGNNVFAAELYDNDAAVALLARFPMTVNMSELNGNEKYHDLNDSLPADAQRIGNIRAGDLMLYGSDCLVLFYESFSSSYSYTRLGYIKDASGLAGALGNGNAEVSFSTDD